MPERALRISVIVAVRDRPGYLVEALHSVLAGAYRDFEIIAADVQGGPRKSRGRRIVSRSAYSLTAYSILPRQPAQSWRRAEARPLMHP